jgi:hypothetical protein
MKRISMWWVFFAFFALMIGGIQTLGLWTRPLAAQSQVAPASNSDDFATATVRHRNCEPKHWRSMFMQQ